MKIDMWYGDRLTDCTSFDCFFNDLSCRYSGNLYKDGRAVGDYSASSLQELEEALNHSVDIERMVTLSTLHISQECADKLALACNNEDEYFPGFTDVCIYPKSEYGWFLYFSEDLRQTVMSDGEVSVEEDLIPLVRFAVRYGCQWLGLDRDGQIFDSLPKYDW